MLGGAAVGGVVGFATGKGVEGAATIIKYSVVAAAIYLVVTSGKG